MVAEDVDLNEVDDRAVEDAVVDVAEGASQNQREGDGGEAEAVAKADEGDEHGDQEHEREADQDPADEMRRSGFGEEGKGRALVGPMGDAEDARDDRDGAADRNVGGDPDLGDAVGQEDERGDAEQPGQAARKGHTHWAASSRPSDLAVANQHPCPTLATFFCRMGGKARAPNVCGFPPISQKTRNGWGTETLLIGRPLRLLVEAVRCPFL